MLRVRDDAAVRWVVVDYPDHRNAIPPEGWDELRSILEDFDRGGQRALVLIGEGEHFCAGADLAAAGRRESSADAYQAMTRFSAAARTLYTLGKPTVAAVDGYAVGAGLGLALGCDIVIATDRARLGAVFARRGLTLDFGTSWVLPRIVGMMRARELALTGRILDAGEALDLGLVTRVVSADSLSGEAAAVAGDLAAGAPQAQRFIKAALARSFEMSLDEALAYESQAQSILARSADAAEGWLSFVERRPPRFEGR